MRLKLKVGQPSAILPYLLLYAIAVLLIVRAFFGFDWSDEGYYLALP